MKSIPLRTLDALDPNDPNDRPIVYKDVLAVVIKRPLNPQSGIQITEMRASLKVLDAIDASNGTLELEDADWQHLREKLLNMAWSQADKRIIQLIEDVETAT